MRLPRPESTLVVLLKSLLFTLLVPATVAGYVPRQFVRELEVDWASASAAVALALFALGALGYAASVGWFALVGRGTPLPLDAPRRLVVAGLHRFVRNPMYLSVLAVIAGWTLLYRSPALALYLCSVAFAFHLMVVLYEEPTLARRFGAEYADYRRAVPRWLPRLARRRERANLLAPPDPAALEVGAGGERLVAKTRLAFFAAIWLIPAVLVFRETRPEVGVSLVAATLAVAASALFVLAARRRTRPRALPFLTSAFDVSIVSATLAAFAAIGRPHVAVNSMVVWEIYLLAIMATVLRFDVRICLFAGGLAIAQYVALLAWVTARWDVRGPDPLQVSGALTGSVQVARLLLLAATTVLAIGAVLRSRRFLDLAGTDQLTGLPNRTYFTERLAAELVRARRTGRPFAVALLDVDHFKRLNDAWGHEVGDGALRLLADVLRSATRASDPVARWGGEELIVVFPETDAAGAAAHLQRLCTELGGRNVPGADSDYRLRFSAGLARFPEDGAVAHELIAAADRRLLRAKSLGRGRVIADDAPA